MCKRIVRHHLGASRNPLRLVAQRRMSWRRGFTPMTDSALLGSPSQAPAQALRKGGSLEVLGPCVKHSSREQGRGRGTSSAHLTLPLAKQPLLLPRQNRAHGVWSCRLEDVAVSHVLSFPWHARFPSLKLWKRKGFRTWGDREATVEEPRSIFWAKRP